MLLTKEGDIAAWRKEMSIKMQLAINALSHIKQCLTSVIYWWGEGDRREAECFAQESHSTPLQEELLKIPNTE